jgi:hypothetical protein
MLRIFWRVVGLIIVTFVLGGCGVATPATPDRGESPTVSALFDARQRAAPPTVTRAPTATRRPTRTPGPPAAQTSRASQIAELVIYDETLAPDWSVDASWGIKLDLADSSHAYTGTVAAAVTPLEDYGALFFALKEGARASFPITNVIGVSLWINSGSGSLTPDDLAVTVIGSNDYTYWVKGDASVQLSDQRSFSETRLRYLGITRTLAPEKWAEVVVRLDKLLYDPKYTYVTGVYVKNDQGFRQTYYVDRVALLLLKPAAP